MNKIIFLSLIMGSVILSAQTTDIRGKSVDYLKTNVIRRGSVILPEINNSTVFQADNALVNVSSAETIEVKSEVIPTASTETVATAQPSKTFLKTGKNTFYYEGEKVKEISDWKDGKREGSFVSYFLNGAKQVEGSYEKGARKGLFKTYNENGVLISEENIIPYKGIFKEDVKDGVAKYYNEKGIIQTEISYKNDVVDGLYKKYNAAGILISEEILEYDEKTKRNLKNGVSKFYYDNGKLKSEGNYSHNLKNGIFKQYDDKGILLSEEHIIIDPATNKETLNGLCKYYYPNGKPKLEANYIKGLKSGNVKKYDEKGVLLSDEMFSYDEKTQKEFRDGLCKTYLPNGKLESEINYVKGLKNGLYKKYNANGILISEENITFNNNQEILNGVAKYFYSDGKPKSEITYKDNQKSGVYKQYSPQDILLSEENIIYDNASQKELLEGVARYYHSNGKLLTSGTYLNGIPQGTWKYYTTTGKVQMEMTCDGRSKQCAAKEYAVNGQVIKEGFMEDNQKTGVWHFYRPDGSIESDNTYKNGKLNGKYVAYFPNKKVEIDGVYSNDQMFGVWTWYYEDGVIRKKGLHRDTLNADWQSFYPTGELEKKCLLKDGVEINETRFYKDGRILKTS